MDQEKTDKIGTTIVTAVLIGLILNLVVIFVSENKNDSNAVCLDTITSTAIKPVISEDDSKKYKLFQVTFSVTVADETVRSEAISKIQRVCSLLQASNEIEVVKLETIYGMKNGVDPNPDCLFERDKD